MQKGFSQVEIHQGNALMSFAGKYYTLIDTIKELVQNVLDNGASVIRVVINMQTRDVDVFGNGFGSTKEGFDRGLRSVCDSQSKETLNPKVKFGRFGIGNFSPIDKCRRYEFTAFDPDSKKTRTWTFEGEKIRKKNTVQIPFAESKVLEGEFKTRAKMTHIITDKVRTKISIPDLVNEIRTEFAVGLKLNSTVLTIEFTDSEGNFSIDTVEATYYEGQKLEEIHLGENDHNMATFSLFLSPLSSGKRSGQVDVGIKGDLFRLPLKKVFGNAPTGILKPDAAKALLSGAFSGEIISVGCELTESRNTFSRNEKLASFCLFINTWWEKFGEDHYEEIRLQKELERFQNLGVRALEMVGRLLSSPDLQEFRDIISGFKTGSIGEGHADIDPRLILGQQDTNSLDVKAKSKEGKGKNSNREGKEHTGHMPLTVGGPRGTRRTEVRDNSLGIQIFFSEMLGDSRMYAFDASCGSLDINIRHPNWVLLEDSDDALVNYQLQCLSHALTSSLWDPSEVDKYYRTCAEPHLSLMVNHFKLIH